MTPRPEQNQTAPCRIRPAGYADLPAISAIYNHYVPISTTTYAVEPETLESRRHWFDAHSARHPVIVAEVDGRVVGWGSLSTFRDRAAYDWTVENSIYIHHEHHRRGIGRALLERLIELARAHGHHTIVAMIDGSQAASIALHASVGFVETARLRQVGRKFERWLDVVAMQLMLE